ncbi:arrestin domain-containing protein 17-like [Teleopsis dalmanni]|uniref:arrestin domain-containing protein 17-like n=1 Tax=Teleopsis dalmanni TaxID=139649 RepID=UPI0018CD8984|nr:arrestin domain-containing protein 17-like [Teleopsis dalmanni]
MVVTCEIEFDNSPYGTYFAGQMLTGKITLKSEKMKQVKAVALKINGFAHTCWSERRGAGKRRRVTHYSGHEDYIASVTYLVGSDQSQSVYIEPGIHTYNFSCHIPAACPSSFEGVEGHVRYTIRVVLMRPWKFDQTYTRGFTVLKVMDLNYNSPLLRMPADTAVQKTYWCGPCKSDPLKVHITLAQTGYVPGQAIPVSVLVANESNVPVDELKIALVMLVCYYSQSPYTHAKTSRTTVTKIKGESVPRNCNKQFTYHLHVPATPPTCFNLCRLIQIAYEVMVEAKVVGYHANQVISTPVTIGNVPLMSVVAQQPTSSSAMMARTFSESAAALNAGDIQNADTYANKNANEAEAGAADSAEVNGSVVNDAHTVATPWATNANIGPPSYEEATHMQHAKINADVEHDYGQSDFAPRYPVFNIPSPTAPAADDVAMVNQSDGKGTWL